jgi:MerR family transcriptional regulator, mercuric resistance operon regulatory protein
VGLTPATIRYYERLGLLPTPERTSSGYRQYDEDVADRLRFIKGAQRFGLRLDENLASGASAWCLSLEQSFCWC